MLRFQTDEIAAVAQHDVRFEWQLPEQFSTEPCSRSRFAHYKRAGSTHIHDIIVAQLFCEEAWAKRPVPANIDTAEENDESHTGIRKGGSPSVGKAPWVTLAKEAYRFVTGSRIEPSTACFGGGFFFVAAGELSRHYRSPCKTSPPGPSPATC